MKNLWLVLAFLCATSTLGFGQDLITNTLAGKRYPKVEQNLKPTVQLIEERKALEGQLTEVDLFRLSNNRSTANLQEWVLDPILLEINAGDLMNTLREAPRDISFAVPVGAGKNIILELTQFEVVTESFQVHTASGKETITGPTGLFYTGIVKDDLNSIATLSLFGNQLRMIIGDRAGTYVLGKMQDDSGQYVLFDERKLLREEANWDCHTVDTPLPPATEKPKSSDTKMMAGGGCVKVYVETEFQVYTDHVSNLLDVTNYILGIMAESIIAYRNIEVNMEVSEIFVWDVADPYSDDDDEDGVGPVLDEFIATRPVFNGDLAHLITTRDIGGGLADGIGSICGAAGAPGPHCVSGSLGASFDVSSLPSTSSTFVRAAHEMGHILGARHTQACVWGPGNNQQIDDCGNSWVLTNGIDEDGDCPGDTNMDGCECCAGDDNVDESDEASAAEGGACFDPMNPVAPNTPNGRGTIMSYCHTQAIGRDILNGFHVEVAAVINGLFLTAACLTDEDCGCEEFTDRTVNGAPIPDGIYYANSTITSSGVATGAAPQVVVFQAGNQIILEPGFIATELFIAQILDDLCTAPAAMSMIVYDQDNAHGTRIANSDTSPQGNELTAYPNPTQGVLFLNLTIEEEVTAAGLRIINQLGQTVYTLPQDQKLEKGQLTTEVNVSSWPAGMYYVVLQTGQETIVRPVVKE